MTTGTGNGTERASEPISFLAVIRERKAQADRAAERCRQQFREVEEALRRAENEQRIWDEAERLELTSGRHARAVAHNTHRRVAVETVADEPISMVPMTLKAPSANGRHAWGMVNEDDETSMGRTLAMLREYGDPITAKELALLLPTINSGTVLANLYYLEKWGRVSSTKSAMISYKLPSGGISHRRVKRYQYLKRDQA